MPLVGHHHHQSMGQSGDSRANLGYPNISDAYVGNGSSIQSQASEPRGHYYIIFCGGCFRGCLGGRCVGEGCWWSLV